MQLNNCKIRVRSKTLQMRVELRIHGASQRRSERMRVSRGRGIFQQKNIRDASEACDQGVVTYSAGANVACNKADEGFVTHSNRGIIGTLTLILIGIGLLGYFRVDIRSILERPEITKVAIFVTDSGKIIWDKYMRDEVFTIAGYISDHRVIEKSVAFSLSAWKKIRSIGEGLGKI